MKVIGYEFVRRELDLPVFPLEHPARSGPYQAVHTLPDGSLAVPRSVAPDTDRTLDHLLFALRYEGTNLQVLSLALRQISADTMLAAISSTPNGEFVRKAAFLWEHFNEQKLPTTPKIGGPYVKMFDPDRYHVGHRQTSPRWRIDFNGLGSLHYCPTVRRTPEIEKMLAADVLGQAREFAGSIGKDMLDRALSWAYLSETENSFAIERETPSADKAQRFVELLRQAHERRELTEDYLSELQSATVANPIDRAYTFRNEQNWLRNGIRGAASVTYVPPPPSQVGPLMDELMAFANKPPTEFDPLVTAGLISFGFVFIHPFMDGNGRLSRFLVHQTLCRSGQLPDGFVLPVSVAMKRHELDYLEALKSFSVPARALWQVRQIDSGTFDMQLRPGADVVYRYWDATPGVEFTLRMAQAALKHDLQHETAYLAAFDRVSRAIDAEHDLRSNDLAVLIDAAFRNGGDISKGLRKKLADRVQPQVFDAVTELVRRELDENSSLGQEIVKGDPPSDRPR